LAIDDCISRRGERTQRKDYIIKKNRNSVNPETLNAYVYDHAGRTRAAIRGFIPARAGLAYEQDQRRKGNPER